MNAKNRLEFGEALEPRDVRQASPIVSIAAVGALAFSAAPAIAEDTSISIVPTADVLPVCAFEGEVFPTAGITTAGEPIAPTEVATSLVNLADSRDQAIGTYSFQCNTPQAAITITTINDFRLVNPSGGSDGQIPYLLKVPGFTQTAGGFTVTTAYLDNTGPGVATTQRDLLIDVGTLNLFDIPPGIYTDQVVVTILPNQ